MTTTIRGTDNTAAAPALTGTDTATGIFFPATNAIAFSTAGTEDMRIIASGSVGIGVTNPDSDVLNGAPILRVEGTGAGFVLRDTSSAGAYALLARTGSSTNLFRIYDIVAGADRATINSSGVFAFNSGYGSAAAAYGCRAWVNFNGTGAVAIRGSANVSSITDNGVGDYTVNYTTSMPDANYGVVGMGDRLANANVIAINEGRGAPVAGAVYIYTGSAHASGVSAGAFQDVNYVFVAIFR